MSVIREERQNFFDFKFGSDLLKKSDEEIGKTIRFLQEMSQIYDAATREINTKLQILDIEFQTKYSHNPIHNIQHRIKKPYSIFEKLEKKGLAANLTNAKEHLFDIAGIRVICQYVNDIYLVERLLLSQDDVTLLQRKDYIENPKDNGYRSLHIVVSVPVFLSEKTENVPVEIQIRTIAMDFWATLEHQLKYKSREEEKAEIQVELLDCALQAAELDYKMQSIHDKILVNKDKQG